MHCLMSSEEWHRKIPFTGYLLAISISVPVVDLESVRRVASGAQKVAYSDGSGQQNAGDGNPQGSPSGDSHGFAYFHLRCLIPCRRK